jgi:2-succinyl-6-hydroxy-2,4-cyclohexadiene-1-carboxylate synthase
VRLATLIHGSGSAATFLHGFTQTKESWLPVRESLTAEIEATLIDAAGHGESPVDGRTLPQSADDVAEFMPTGVLVGYSMGARIALHTALQHPEKVRGLVLVSGTPGLRSESERVERREADEALANRIEAIGVSQFIPEWLSNPMFKGLSAQYADIPKRNTNTEQGLANSLRYAGTGNQEPLWEKLKNLQMPVLIITGEHDQKFTDIGREMAAEIPNCEYRVMSGVGHTCHLEDISQFVHIFEEWFLRL